MRRLLLPATIVLWVALCGPASAATFTVISSSDAADATPGDGACVSTLLGGACTLRAAVHEANALAGADQVQIAGGVDPTFSIAPSGANDVTTGDLDVTEALTLAGQFTPRPVISAANLDRVLDVTADVAVTVAGVELADGRVTDEDGAGIRSAGDLTLDRVVLRDNTGLTGSGYPRGGGVRMLYTNTLLTVTDSTMSDNSAAAGGGISAGGLSSQGGGIVLRRSLVEGNTASSSGGGVEIGGTAEIEATTFTGNNETNNGGAAFVANPSSEPSTITLRHSTIAGNGPGNIDQGVRVLSGATLEIEGSIFSGGDFRPTCLAAGGTITSLGHNVTFGNAAGGGCAFTATGDIAGDPGLTPLADNGGPTETMLPSVSGAALDAGGGACSALDQRGVARPQGVSCDAGAVELVRSSDVRISAAAAPATLGLGGVVMYTFTVANDGPHATGGVVAELTPPAGAEVVSADPTCTGPPPLRCAVGQLAAGASTSVALTVRPAGAGAAVSSAGVSANPTDPNPGNNSVQASALVAAPPTTTNPQTSATTPRVTSLSLTRKRFRPGRGRGRGTAFRLDLSVAGKLRITIERKLRGGRHRRVGALVRTLPGGRAKVAFSGRLGKRTLAPGTYRATVTLSAGGERSAPRRVSFRVLP